MYETRDAKVAQIRDRTQAWQQRWAAAEEGHWQGLSWRPLRCAALTADMAQQRQQQQLSQRRLSVLTLSAPAPRSQTAHSIASKKAGKRAHGPQHCPPVSRCLGKSSMASTHSPTTPPPDCRRPAARAKQPQKSSSGTMHPGRGCPPPSSYCRSVAIEQR